MAVLALTDARIYIAEYDISADTNQVETSQTVADLDSTNFDSAGWNERIAGLKTAMYDISGFINYAAGQSEDAFDGALGVAGTVVSIAADSGEGDTAVFGRGLNVNLQRGAKVGDIAPVSGSITGSHPQGMVEGVLLGPKTSISGATTAASNGVQVGAVSASETAYAVLHVFSVSGGGTLDIGIQSDDNSGFTSATERIGFTNATGATSEWASVAGAITDDYWRVSIGLDTGAATFAVCFGVA